MAERFRSVAEVDAEIQRLRDVRSQERQRLQRTLKAVADPVFRRNLMYNGVRRTLAGVHWLQLLGDIFLPGRAAERDAAADNARQEPDAGRIAGGLLRMALPGLLAWFLTPERLERLGAEAGRSLMGLRARWRERRASRSSD